MRINGINIADLDKKFIIETPTTSIDPVTNEKYISAWNTYATVWGKWMENSNDKFEADQQVNIQDGKIVIRFTDGVSPTMRVNDGGEYHYIKGIDLVDRRITMLLKTEKRNNV